MAIKELFNDARPQVLFDPRASQRIDPRFKFTRNGPASYYDRDGVLRVMAAPANQPRVGFSYEPDQNGIMQPTGLLLEPAKTNLLTRSEEFNILWTTGSGAGVTPNQAEAPDETLTADLVGGISTSSHLQQNVTTSGLTYTFSVYAKPNTLSSFGFGGTGLGTWASFNLSTRTCSSNARIEILPNDWFRCSATQALTSSSIRLVLGAGNLYFWGAQLEESAYATSYIPTITATVTRAAELLSIESPLPTTGSIYIDARSLSSAVDSTLLSAAPASPSTDKLALAIRQPASLYNSKALVYEVDGAFKPTLPFPVPTNARERNLITYGANNYHYRSDSARYTPSSSTSVPANMTRLGIGHDVTDPTKAMTGYINAVYLWPGEITPTVAEALVRGDVDPKDADAGVFTPAAGSLAFVFNTQGTSTDGNTVVQLPLRGSTNNVLVDWGDNTSSSLIGSAASVTVNHTYPAAGIYPVQIEADSDGTNSGLAQLQFYANSPADLVRVLQWGGTTTFKPTTMYRAFRDCVQLDFATAARTNLPDTSAITNWSEAFYGCASLSGSFPSFNFSAATTFANAWYGCSSLVAFPAAGDQTQNVTSFEDAWRGCSSLGSFPLINTSLATNFSRAWQECSSLTSFPAINTSQATSFYATWNVCSSLTSFPTIDTSKVTNFAFAWRLCSSLTTFPLLNTSSATTLEEAWNGCSSLTSFPLLNTSNVTNFSAAWAACSGLIGFPLLDTSSGTNFTRTWNGCSSLTSFPLLDTSSGTNFSQAFRSCTSLVSFPVLDTSQGTNFERAWELDTGLVAFPPLDLSAATGLASDSSTIYTGFRDAWKNCTSLASFPANRFDTTACTRFIGAWVNCALTAQSIENILVSINTAGTSNGNLSLEGGTNADTSTWSTAANNAYIALVGRGWTITQNGTAPS